MSIVRKTLLLVFFVFMLETSNASFTQEMTTATNQFSLNLLKAVLQNNTGNTVVSPVSVHVLLAILQQGAYGNTRQEIDNTVHAQPNETKQAYHALTARYQNLVSHSRLDLEFRTKAFAGAGLHLKPEFKETLISDFQSDIESVNFQDGVNASAHINSWVSQATHNKINELISPDDIDGLTRLILVNAIFFKSFWDNPFQEASNKPYSPTNGTEVQVPTLSQVEFYKAGECSHIGAKYVHIDFVDDDSFTLLLILPTERHGLDALVNRLTAENLTNIFSHSGLRRVTLQFPKFRLRSDSNLNNVLQALGINQVFQENNANLSGITEELLYLSKAIQKAEILADEQGVTAAAATGFTFYALSGRVPPIAEDMDFKADHPFLVFIVDRTYHTPLFAGRVTNPSEQ